MSSQQNKISKIPYDHLNPLSWTINGAVQVKDLPKEEQDKYVKDFQDEQEKYRKEIVEFKFKVAKSITKMEDMPEIEKKQWLIFLESEKVELLEQYDDLSNIDFFDSEFEEYHGWNEEIMVNVWEWTSPGGTPMEITDIFAYPGDNQSGGIFIGTDLIFRNSDARLSFPGWKYREPESLKHANPKYPLLNERKKTFSHLKGMLTIYGSSGCHEYCDNLYEEYHQDEN